MPIGTVALPDFSKNQLLDLASIDGDVQKYKLNELALEAKGMQNDYVRQTQPAQVNLLLQGLAGLTAPEQAATPDTSAAPTNGAPSAAAPGGSFEARLAQGESGGNPRAVNAQGYSGQAQFSAARLADPNIGIYTPAQGENLRANEWRGTFNIPGHPEIKTHADFLASPDAQHVAFATHVADIDHAIAQTPGAERLNKDGLRAVAHLGGVEGMQKFVATGGQYNPKDNNQTHLSDYYAKYGQGGAPALARDFGTGVGGTGGGVPVPPGRAPEPRQNDPAALAATRRLLAMGQYYAALPDGKGARAAAAIQQQLDNIAGPGAIIVSSGQAQQVPGSYASRYAASQATEAGKSGPSAALHATNAGVDRETFGMNQAVRGATDQATHAANAGVDRTTHSTNAGIDAGLARETFAQNQGVRGVVERETHAVNTGVDAERALDKPIQVPQGATVATPRTLLAPQPQAGGSPQSVQGTRPGVYVAPKELPPPIQAMDNEDVQTIQTAAGIKADLGALRKQIEDGKLQLGGIENVQSRARNAMGVSSENSRNFASFEAAIHKMTNDSLNLAKGTQTEGDAQRASSALIAGINDPAVVKQRLAEIEAINERSVQARATEMNRRRTQNGAEPIDPATITRQPATVGQGGRPAVPAVGTVMQGHRFLGGDPSKPASWQAVH